MATPTAYESKGFFYFMKLEMKFRFTADEQACLYILKEKLKKDVNLRNKCDSAVLIPLFERFIEQSMNATLLDPFINNEL
jgi:hypothetical protein